MKHLEYWDRFEKSGNIYDYLNYTACTLESGMGGVANGSDDMVQLDGLIVKGDIQQDEDIM